MALLNKRAFCFYNKVMQIKSLGLNSELFFYNQNSIVEHKENYIKISTPSNPLYFWGNLLIYSHPPTEIVFDQWIADFKKEFGNNDQIKHMTFTWDPFGEKPAISKFLDKGFHLEETIVLGTDKLTIQYPNSNYIYREITSDSDWKQVIDLQIDVGIETENYRPDIYREFVEKRFNDYKLLVSRGNGKWFGAFLGNRLVADLGLFGENNFKRFQSIETHKDFRRQGITQNLILHASKALPTENFIIHATQNGPAIDLYMRMGFEIKEVISGVCLFDQESWKSK